MVALLTKHGRFVKDNVAKFRTALRACQKCLLQQKATLGQLCESNKHALKFLCASEPVSLDVVMEGL